MSYQDFSIEDLEKLASESSSELGELAFGRLKFYKTGDIVQVDEETALFLASARSIVLELIRRLRESENIVKLSKQSKASLLWIALSDKQRSILLAARKNYTMIRENEKDAMKEACRLQAQGFITLELFNEKQAIYEANLTLKARELLAEAKV